MDNIARYYGVYRGVVKSVADPLNQRRVKLVVPQTTGDRVTGWAWPLETAHTHFEVPPVGQGVWVIYQGGDPDYPLWMGSFGKAMYKGKLPFVKALPNSEDIDDVVDLLTVVDNKDGTTDYDLTQTVLNIVRNRYWGTFLNTTTQTTGSENEEHKVILNETVDANGITNNSGTLTFSHKGVYNVDFSMQLTNLDTQAHDAKVWAKQNGSSIPNSASVVTIPGTHGGIAGHSVLTVNILVDAEAGDTFELWGGANSTQVRLETLAAGAAVSIGPASPAVILNVTKAR